MLLQEILRGLCVHRRTCLRIAASVACRAPAVVAMAAQSRAPARPLYAARPGPGARASMRLRMAAACA